MNTLKILIVEDEIITATDLKETLEKYGHQITDIAKNHQEAILSIEKQIPDLMILDIRLRNSTFDGIEIANQVTNEYNLPFVYLTSHSESQTFERAKETKPAAYLLKPFRHRELAFQIDLAYNHYLTNKVIENNPVKSENIFLPLEKGHQRIIKSNVIFLKAEGAYVNVYVADEKKPFLFSMNIGHLAQYFTTSNFCQISRSYIINLNYMSRLDSENIYMNYYDGKIPLPQNRKSELMKKLAVIRTP